MAQGGARDPGARDRRTPADSESAARPGSGRASEPLGASTSEALEEFAAVLRKMAAEGPLRDVPLPRPIAAAPTSGDAAAGDDEPASPIRTYSYGVADLDGRPVTYTIVSPPEGGQVLDKGDGTFDFDPGDDFNDLGAGETREVSFTYQAFDSAGGVATATITVTLTGRGDGAAAVAGEAVEAETLSDAGSGIETLHIDGVSGAPGAGGWAVALNKGEILETNIDNLVLSDDAVGVVILGSDTSEIFFEGINRIEW